MSACRTLGWDEPKVHDSASRIDDIDAAMEKPIFKHTVVLIKHFWRASKRLIRTNVGGTYETTPGKMDTTATSQGLTARFCDNFVWKGEQESVNLRPLHFTDVAAVRQYLNWYNEGCVYGKVPYDAARMKSDGTGPVKAPKSKVHPTNVVGLEGVAEEEGPVKTISFALSPTFQTLVDAKKWCTHNLTYGKSGYKRHAETCTNSKCGGCGAGTHIKYRKRRGHPHLRPLLTEAELRSSIDAKSTMDVQWGIKDGARVMPVLWITDDALEGADKARVMPVKADAAIVWIAIYRKDKRRAVKGKHFFGGY
jgi:hypothetical protein